jgi:hypothetical protein
MGGSNSTLACDPGKYRETEGDSCKMVPKCCPKGKFENNSGTCISLPKAKCRQGICPSGKVLKPGNNFCEKAKCGTSDVSRCCIDFDKSKNGQKCVNTSRRLQCDTGKTIVTDVNKRCNNKECTETDFKATCCKDAAPTLAKCSTLSACNPPKVKDPSKDDVDCAGEACDPAVDEATCCKDAAPTLAKCSTLSACNPPKVKDPSKDDVDCAGEACDPAVDEATCCKDAAPTLAKCSTLSACIPPKVKDPSKDDVDCAGEACDPAVDEAICCKDPPAGFFNLSGTMEKYYSMSLHEKVLMVLLCLIIVYILFKILKKNKLIK